MAHSYKTILKKIILKLGFGFKKDRIEACLGEEIPLELDEKLFKNKVSSQPPTKKNSLVIWNKEDGTEIKDSKTTQDDNGNIETVTSFNGELTDSLRNNKLGVNTNSIREVAVGGGAGNPILRINRVGIQVWDQYCERSNKSFYIRGENKERNLPPTNFFEITRRGAVKHLNQPQGLIVLENSTQPVTGNNNWYRLGSFETWTAIFDNYKIFTSLGGSTANPLKAVLNEGGSFQFKVGIHVRNSAVPANQTFFQFRILTKGREYFSFGNTAAGLSDGYLSDNIGIIADINDELLFELWGGIAEPQTTINIIGTKWPILHTGIFYYLMG